MKSVAKFDHFSVNKVNNLLELWRKRLVRGLAVALLVVAALPLSLFSIAAYAADGDTNVVTDPQLQACINATKFSPARPATTPISAAEMAALTGNISTVGYSGVASFEGLQYATQLGSLTFSFVTITDMTPISQMTNLNAINIQSHTTPNGVIDLTPLAPIASEFLTLNINNSVWVGAVPTTQIIGLGAFVNLTSFSANNNALSNLPGLSSLTQLNNVYLNSNNFGNDVFSQLPNKSFSILNLARNHISDFTNIPTATTRWLAGQTIVGTDVLLASADQDTFVANPLNRPVSYPGGGIYNYSISGIDTGPVEFDATDFYTASELISWRRIDLSSIPAAYQEFAYYTWRLDPLNTADINNFGVSYMFFPMVVVDMIDDPDLEMLTDTATDLAFMNFSYSVNEPGRPAFTPTGFTLESGTLPAGITLDPDTGRLVGTTVELGSFAFTISATDANGLVVVGDFELTVSNPPVKPPVIPPTGDAPGFGSLALILVLSVGGCVLLVQSLRRRRSRA